MSLKWTSQEKSYILRSLTLVLSILPETVQVLDIWSLPWDKCVHVQYFLALCWIFSLLLFFLLLFFQETAWCNLALGCCFFFPPPTSPLFPSPLSDTCASVIEWEAQVWSLPPVSGTELLKFVQILKWKEHWEHLSFLYLVCQHLEFGLLAYHGRVNFYG